MVKSWMFYISGARNLAAAGIAADDVRPRYLSGAEVLDQYFGGGRITHQDAFYDLVDVSIVPRMRQTHPPVWVTATSKDSFRWAATRGYKVCSAWLPTPDVAELSAVYHSAAADAGRVSGADSRGLRRRVFVAPTDSEAHDIVANCDEPLLISRDRMLKSGESGTTPGNLPRGEYVVPALRSLTDVSAA